MEQPPKKRGGITGNKNPMLHDNLSRILNWYKGRVTFESRKLHADFAWQSRFHDHIIRNDAEYRRIKNYIINNPKNWNDDLLHR
jgi:REP element-mobilizing transposase RayT